MGFELDAMKITGGDSFFNDIPNFDYEFQNQNIFNFEPRSDTHTNSLHLKENSEKISENKKKVFDIKKEPKIELTVKERIEIKKFLTKRKLEMRKNKEKMESNELIKKKEIKSIRNRLASQKSRDKKKKLFVEMKTEIDKMRQEIFLYENTISKACQNCKELFNKNSQNGGIRFAKLGLLTSVIVVVCLIGNMFISGRFSESNSLQERNLLRKNASRFEIPLILTLPDHKNIYNHNKSRKGNSTNLMIPQNKSIMLTKNYQKLQNSKKSIILRNQRNLFLEKLHSILKINQAHKIVSYESKHFRFLDKDELKNYSTCLNENKLRMSAQSFNSIKYNLTTNISKNSDKNKSMIPIQDYYLEKNLENSVKSILCSNPIHNSSDRNLFSKLFKKLENGENNNINDCFYIHLLLPSSNVKVPEESEKIVLNNNKLYYEVGCKVFELNKIYR